MYAVWSRFWHLNALLCCPVLRPKKESGEIFCLPHRSPPKTLRGRRERKKSLSVDGAVLTPGNLKWMRRTKKLSLAIRQKWFLRYRWWNVNKRSSSPPDIRVYTCMCTCAEAGLRASIFSSHLAAFSLSIILGTSNSVSPFYSRR